MKSQAYRMTMLFDFYGDVLTDRQKEFYDLYYNEDRAEAVLTELEDKTGLIKRFHTMKAQLDQVFQDAGRMVELAARLDSAELETLALRVRDTADTLLKE